jgi:hypothetical protein
LNVVISVSSFSLGISPRSDCSFALISTMTRISPFLLGRGSISAFYPERRTSPTEIDTFLKKFP